MTTDRLGATALGHAALTAASKCSRTSSTLRFLGGVRLAWPALATRSIGLWPVFALGHAALRPLSKCSCAANTLRFLKRPRFAGALLAVCVLSILTGCDQMAKQPRADAQESSEFFPDGKVNQAPPVGTVARGELAWEAVLDKRPPLTPELLERGAERYRVNCVPCHGVAGDGLGTVVQRGFPQPPDFTEPRLMNAPDRHFLEVIAKGYGVMYSYAARVKPADRWAIVAHIRSLQLARNAKAAELPEADRQVLEAQP